jgi:hypothetical protein
VAGNSAFAAGYLVVLLVSPLLGCAFGAVAGLAADGSQPPRPWPRGGGPPLPRPAPATSRLRPPP